ncbi:MAG: DNA sulfur modification protein DndD, partial [Phycisphaerae bacterium]|nr:DNA sulfur modification protein DndD [Phycisphaerae bacterium]
RQIWQDFLNATIPQSITQFFFFDGEKIQEIASDDHSEVRLKSSLEAALGIQYINRLSQDITYVKNDERKNFVEISDEDLQFKESQLKLEKSKLDKKKVERAELQSQLDQFKAEKEEAEKRFKAAFHADPATQESQRQRDKMRIQASNRLGQVENEIKTLCEKSLAYSLAGGLFAPIKKQIDTERETAQYEAIKEHAAELAKQIVRVVEEPEPIYREKLTPDKMAELEQRIFHLLSKGNPASDIPKVLNLSERDAVKVLQKIDEIEKSEIFMVTPLLEEKAQLEAQIRQLERDSLFGASSDSEKELFDQLQAEIESYATQIGRKTEQLNSLDDDILTMEKHIQDLQAEIDTLYDKHHISRDKVEFLNECDALANLLNQFVIRLRQNKIHLLQEKTFEMYLRLSSKSGLIKDLKIDEKTYEITVTGRDGTEIKKSGLSAGEKEIFAVSLLWGLAQTSELKLPIIIDTPLSRLDSAHRDNIVNNYFPNAADQVIILSTDTEIDTEYYKMLEPHLSGAANLEFDQRQELTTVKEGYFWEN